MKLIMLLILNSCMVNKGIQKPFIDRVTNDFERYSYFLSIKVGEKVSYIIENDDLYYYVQNIKSIGKEQYQKEIKVKLINGGSFEINNPNSNFIKVPNIPSVVANAKKGADEFIKVYFDNGKVLKDGVTDDERTVIIQKRFEWEIASKIDDETGYLVISR